MTRILTVEDSRAMRSVITKALGDCGFELDEAENGEQGLAKAQASGYDLILLDITMPVMDGATMLRALRTAGNKTPVILLTAESKTSIIGGMARDGVQDYILKPFKPEELRGKVDKVLARLGLQTSSPGAGAQRESADILVADDMENVAKRLRVMVPEKFSLQHAADAQASVAACRGKNYRAVLVDSEIPGVDVPALVGQLQALQPQARFMALLLRNAENKAQMARDMGCHGVLVKPFVADEVADFLATVFDSNDLLTAEDNVLRLSPRAGQAQQFEKLHRQIITMIAKETERLAAASFADVILDFGSVEACTKLVYVMVKSTQAAQAMGLEIKLVMPAASASILKGFQETKDLAVFDNVAAALGSGTGG